MSKPLMIGDLARMTATKVNTIRFYEDTGLLPRAARTMGGRRVYYEGDLRRLAFIRHARSLGFSTAVIRSLLDLAGCPERDCDEARDIARSHLEDVKQRIGQLKGLQAELTRMIEGCNNGDKVANCRIIGALANPSTAGSGGVKRGTLWT